MSVCLENCSSAVAQLCHYGTGQNVASPQAKWEQICRVQLFSLGPTLPRESALLTVSGSWVILLLLFFEVSMKLFFLGHHKCNFNNRLPSIIIPIGSILAVAAARVLVSD